MKQYNPDVHQTSIYKSRYLDCDTIDYMRPSGKIRRLIQIKQHATYKGHKLSRCVTLSPRELSRVMLVAHRKCFVDLLEIMRAL